MLMIVGFVLAFIAFFVPTMMTFQGNLPVPVAVIISALMVALLYWFTNGIVDMPYLWHK
ncbi:TPA: hypothetical protein R4K09_001650 [Campylobacter coli]|nr:hypothetical protein [Campylobacter coli]HED0453329.1 hypothetical protein [Campylobacter coli]HED0460558.1 hypothetical protein [Campylobacter coli]HED1141064.1 hypothetical protein [Campylobacter coli]